MHGIVRVYQQRFVAIVKQVYLQDDFAIQLSRSAIGSLHLEIIVSKNLGICQIEMKNHINFTIPAKECNFEIRKRLYRGGYNG